MTGPETAHNAPEAAGSGGAAPDTCADAPECRALVRVRPPRRWGDAGARVIAAICYFAWLGYITAPLPLLLRNLQGFRSRPELAYHIFNATGWSLFVVALRALLIGAAMWAGTCQGETAEAVCNALTLAHLVVVLTFALLLSTVYAVEALLGRQVTIPLVSRWARRRTHALMSGGD